MPKAQKHYEDCSKSCSSAKRIPSQQMQDFSRDEPRFTVAIGPNGRARTPLLDQDHDRTRAKSSGASQIELSETLLDVPDAGTLVAAVPVQRDRRSMSRRPGQNGRIEKRGDSFSFLFYQDVPGTTKRQRVRRALKATTMVAAKQEAQRIIDAEGVNTGAHLEASRGPVVTFDMAAELWKFQQLQANGKHSSKRTMGCELNKHVLPHLKDTPIQDITYPVIRGLVRTWKKEGLGIKFPTRSGMHAFRHGRISYLAYSGVTFAVIREWVGHGSDAMIKHYMAKWQSNNATEMGKLQPVVRAQKSVSDGNEVALLEPVGTSLQGKEVGVKAA